MTSTPFDQLLARWRDEAFHPGQPCKHRLAVYLHRMLAGGVRRALRQAVGAST